ncbi:MAG: dithiol-disulfide isomerase [Chitinophagaceae bacterium]|nr:MAG: dithiol-disulfide isomerase [Chitinophagaceae bacterium]
MISTEDVKLSLVPSSAFNKCNLLRAEHITNQIHLERNLKNEFLYPTQKADDTLIMPVMEKQISGRKKTTHEKSISVLYFTDPICSTCWIIQPQLRKLQLEYNEHLNIDYKMGGLLPSWKNYNRFGIKKPSDVAAHWEEVCSYYEMPINKHIWLEDPLPSSYPPSIAFKAAQLQDTDKAVLFLRRIREMVFLEKKNIIKKEFLHRAAFDVGLDPARLLRDLEDRAKEKFKEDLILSDQLNIQVLPTLIFSNHKGIQLALNGFQPYESFVNAIKQLNPDATKSEYQKSPKYLFEEFQTMTSKEFSF